MSAAPKVKSRSNISPKAREIFMSLAHEKEPGPHVKRHVEYIIK